MGLVRSYREVLDLPDNLLGGLLLSLINMTVVFGVLGFLALAIRAVAKMVHAAETPQNTGGSRLSPATGGGSEGLSNEGGGGTGTAPGGGGAASPIPAGTGMPGAETVTGTGFEIRTVRDANGTCADLTVEERVAVIAAVMAVMASAGRRHVFVRGLKDSGAWGKLGKAGSVHQGRSRR